MNRLKIAVRIAAGLASNEAKYRPSDIVTLSLQITDGLIKKEAETRSETDTTKELPFEIVVGGEYEMRNGKIEKIKQMTPFDSNYPFLGESGRTYTNKGIYSIGNASEYDLIKQIR